MAVTLYVYHGVTLLYTAVRECTDRAEVLSVRLSTPGRHPKTSSFDVAEGRI